MPQASKVTGTETSGGFKGGWDAKLVSQLHAYFSRLLQANFVTLAHSSRLRSTATSMFADNDTPRALHVAKTGTPVTQLLTLSRYLNLQ